MSQVSCVPCIGSPSFADFDAISDMKSQEQALRVCEMHLPTHVGSPKIELAKERSAQREEE